VAPEKITSVVLKYNTLHSNELPYFYETLLEMSSTSKQYHLILERFFDLCNQLNLLKVSENINYNQKKDKKKRILKQC